MKRLALLVGVVAGLVAVSVLTSRDSRGQWAVNSQVDQRVGPIYSPNPEYNFYSHEGDNSAFSFNWATGHWDYAPFGFDNNTPAWKTTPQQPNTWAPSRQDYSSVYKGGLSPGAVPANQAPPTAPGNSVDDTGLWNPPTTAPTTRESPQIVKFGGRIVGVRAIQMGGSPYPHLLVRLENPNGANGTADVGEVLKFPAVGSPTDLDVTVSGKLGTIDGNLVLFADTVCFGSKMCEIVRHGGAPR